MEVNIVLEFHALSAPAQIVIYPRVSSTGIAPVGAKY